MDGSPVTQLRGRPSTAHILILFLQPLVEKCLPVPSIMLPSPPPLSLYLPAPQVPPTPFPPEALAYQVLQSHQIISASELQIGSEWLPLSPIQCGTAEYLHSD